LGLKVRVAPFYNKENHTINGRKMTEAEKFKAMKRFGARYGRKMKERFGKIEKEQRKYHKCPYCAAVKVKRLAIGIWNCRKCGAKFTGKAYTTTKKISIEEVPENG
jgi:large subunit ribosomal protein L37Ae